MVSVRCSAAAASRLSSRLTLGRSHLHPGLGRQIHEIGARVGGGRESLCRSINQGHAYQLELRAHVQDPLLGWPQSTLSCPSKPGHPQLLAHSSHLHFPRGLFLLLDPM